MLINELQIKLLETNPAVVSFNYDEISKHLDELLKKYTEIIITEDTIKDGKKVIADLRKGQKSLDEFRKKIKKDLTAPVKEFEDKCKELGKKFDEVINPINKQAEQFEVERRKEKKIEVQQIVNEVCDLKRLSNLPIEDIYLNKSMSLKAIKTDLMKVADNILLQQSTLKANTDLIKSKIELINTRHNINLMTPQYVLMLNYEDIKSVLLQIEKDAESFKSKVIDVIQQETQVVKSEVQSTSKDEEIFVDIYEIEGTEEQLNALEDFLNANGYKWRVVND